MRRQFLSLIKCRLIVHHCCVVETVGVRLGALHGTTALSRALYTKQAVLVALLHVNNGCALVLQRDRVAGACCVWLDVGVGDFTV